MLNNYQLITIQGKISGNGNYGLRVLEGVDVVQSPMSGSGSVYPIVKGPPNDQYPLKVLFAEGSELHNLPTRIISTSYDHGKLFVPKVMSGEGFSMKNVIIALDIQIPPRWRMVRPWAMDLEIVDGSSSKNPWCIRTSPIGNQNVYRFDSLEPNDIIALQISRGSKLDQILFVWKDGHELTGPEDGSKLRYIQDLLSI